MKHFGFIFAFISAAIAAPTPGWPDNTSHGFIPPLDVQKIINDEWKMGEKKDCIFWTGFDGGIPIADLDKMKAKVPTAVSWFNFYDLHETRVWDWGTGDANSGYSIGLTSSVFAERCCQDGTNVYLMIPANRTPEDPYPVGSKKPRTANCNRYESAWVTMPGMVEKIIRVDPSSMDADINKDDKIIWKKGDPQIGFTARPIADSSIWDPIKA